MQKNLIDSLFFIVLILSSQICSLSLNNKSTSLLSLNTKASCDSEKAMGFTGNCKQTTDLIQTLNLPQNVESILEQTIVPMIESVGPYAGMCLGDFSGSYLTSSEMSQYTCDSFPLDTNYNYGVLAIALNNVPCGKPVKVAICAAFDRCGTVAFSINGGLIACAAAYTTGIGAALSTVADGLDYINLAISIPKRLVQTFKITYGEGSNVISRDVTTRGHLSIGAGLKLPMDYVKIKGKSLGEFLALQGKILIMIDLGSVGTFINQTIENLKKMNKSIAKDTVNSIVKSGAELTAHIQGNLVLGFEDLTSGLISDLEINIGRVSVLIAAGAGESGMKTGLYIFLQSTAINNILEIIDKVLKHFDGILNAIGFKRPSFPSVNISLGIFVQTDSAGFQFTIPGFTIKCIYMFDTKKGSCQFADKFFTALIQGAKWVIKKAGKFFDDAGDQIAEFGSDVADFAQESGKAIKQAADKAAEEARKAAERAAEEARKAAERAAEEARKAAEKAAEEAKRAAERAAEEAKKAADKVKKCAKKIFSFKKC